MRLLRLPFKIRAAPMPAVGVATQFQPAHRSALERFAQRNLI